MRSTWTSVFSFHYNTLLNHDQVQQCIPKAVHPRMIPAKFRQNHTPAPAVCSSDPESASGLFR